MSFSSNVKEELSKLSTLKDKQSVKAELIGYLVTNNINIDEKNIRFSSKSEYNINRFSKLLSNLNVMNHKIDIQGKIYTISLKKIDLRKIVNLEDENLILNDNIYVNKQLEDEIYTKSIVRGAFLGGGSINNPENKYHLEIIFSLEENAKYIANILNGYEIECKILNKSHCYSLYSKEGETISNLLAFIGASSSVLKFEEIRVVRDMRNNVNRLVNCETANLNKIINASLKQIEDIKLIKEKNQFKDLSKNLQEIANLRLKNPEASLIELGGMLEVPVGKSGVNHRLKAISEIADEIRKSEEEDNKV